MRVDFYLIKQPKIEQCANFICRLIDKAYRHDHHIYLQTSTDTMAQYFDDLLWTFQDNRFIPHERWNQTLQENLAPIQIGTELFSKTPQDILINLCESIPENHSAFQRVIEIVGNDPKWREQSREHFKFYRSQGYTVQSHDIEG